MFTLPSEVSSVLLPFQVLFKQQRSWDKAEQMLVGAILCRGKRTVSRVLETLGLGQSKEYSNYYRILNRVGWSGLAGAQILLSMLVGLLSPELGIVIGIDETLERRWGKKIWGLGIYRDAVKSSHKHKVKSSGVRWQVMQVLLPLPWSQRVWALPFLSAFMPSPSTPLEGNQRYKTSLDWAAQMVSVVSRWLKRPWICVADGAYGNAKFGWACRRHGVTLVSRLPWKANLYDFAPVAPPRRQRGRPRTKGALLPSMQQRLEGLSSPTLLSDRLPLNESSRFQILRWYGGTHALRQLVTGTAVWDVDGYPPLPLRWVLVVDPTGQQPPTALFSTNLALSAGAIVELFVSRWSLEVTFEEARAHLGFQSQRQWAKAATTRTTPVILAMFSLVCLIAHRLYSVSPISPRSTAWYSKSDLTFADLLDAVRLCLWRERIFSRPTFSSALALFSDDDREQLIQLLAAPF
jgi:DDE superfamily endonuclease